jgi:hypothetical protein
MLLLLALAACAPTTQLVAIKPQAIDVHTLPECFAACGSCSQPAQTITADPDSAVVAAITEHILRKQCAGELALCETRRQACSDAIKRGQRAGAIR